MENRRFGLGVVLYIFDMSLSEVLLLGLNPLKRERFNADWGNMGGKVNLGETSRECAVRESGEEIGVRFNQEDLSLLYVREIPSFAPLVHAVQFVYGTSIYKSTPIILGPEIERSRWFNLNDLPERTLDTREDFYDARNRLIKLRT